MAPLAIDHEPTLNDLDRLEEGQYFLWDNQKWVKGIRRGSQIHFICPFCFTKYKKDGAPYAKAKRKEHHSGGSTEQVGTVVQRASHCDRDRLSVRIGIFDQRILI